MENAHVLIRLCDNDTDQPQGSGDTSGARSPLRSDVGVRRTSATSVRLEHSDMSPGVASISFERVFDHRHTNAQIFEQSLADAVGKIVLEGSALTVVATGAAKTGKSFCMHGDLAANNKDKGLLELAIERVFAVVSEFHEWQVLLTAGFTQDDKAEKSGSLVDSFSNEPIDYESVDPASALLVRAVRVENVSEAIRAYRNALDKCMQTDQATPSTDFLCVLFVESRAKSGIIRRSRLCFIDVHGNNIVEPTHLHDHGNDTKPTLFAETHFPVNGTLSKWCGGFLGNTSSTFHLVAIHTAPKKQQLAIQSLLYACKAKEIKSVSEICELDAFSVIPTYADVEAIVDEPEGHDGVLLSLSSPVSSLSTLSTPPSRHQSASDLLSERLRQAYQSVKSSTNKGSADMSPHVKTVHSSGPVVSNTGATMQQLHAKTDAILSPMQFKTVDLETMTLLEKLDAIATQYREVERSLQHETSVKKKCVERISKLSQTMSFQVVEHEKLLKAKDEANQALRVKLETMQSKYDDAEQTLESLQLQVEAMKVSMRERATARSPAKTTNERVLLQQFSARLETAMQEAKAVVDHKDTMICDLEARIEQLQDANDALKCQISSASIRFREEESRWMTLQRQWEKEKARWIDEQNDWNVEKSRWMDEANLWGEEKARLMKEKTEWEAEKDRLQIQVARGSEEKADWVGKQAEWEQAESNWISAKAEWKNAKVTLEKALVSCQENVKMENMRTQDLVDRLALSQREWSAKVLELEQMIERERHHSMEKQTGEVLSREERIAQLESTLRSHESVVIHEREKLVELEAAKIAIQKQVVELQGQLHEERTACAKEKKKLEKKLRILMSERKQQLEDTDKVETEMALEVQRLGLELEAVRSGLQCKAAELEHTRSLLSELHDRLAEVEKQRSVSDEQIAVLQDCNARLETDKRAAQDELEHLEKEKRSVSEELEQRTYALEQRAARQLVEQDAKLSSENEYRLRDLMERHSSELLQRDLELRRLRTRRAAQPPQLLPVSSSSSSSSSSSESFSHKQRDLEQLDAIVDTSGSSSRQKIMDKRRDDKIAKQKQKIAVLRTQLDALTHALAVANEQESLAKEAIEQQQALYERMMYAQDELQTQVNVLKEENWMLNLALQVTEKRGPVTDNDENMAFLPMSSRIAEC